MKCPVCGNTNQNNKNYCSHCGWGMMDDVSVFGSLFSDEQIKEYQERIQLYRTFVKKDFREETVELLQLREKLQELETNKEKSGIESETKYRMIEDYFRSYMKVKAEIGTVDMAFHSGPEWLSNIEKNDMLYELADAGVKFRILLNTPEKSELIGKHMRHQRKSYMSFEECIKHWKIFKERYPDQVEVRVIDIPILHRYYSFHMKDTAQDTVNIKYYTYANVRPGNNYQSCFAYGSDFFRLYRDEFEYLWNSKANPNPELCAKNQLVMNQLQEKMIYVKAPNRDWETVYELKENGDVIRYESTGGSIVCSSCKTIAMIYYNSPFAACVRTNGQVICCGGTESELKEKLEAAEFKVKDIVSNYYGTFLLNEAGGVVGINNFSICGLDDRDSGFKMGYFKNLPKSGVCKLIARDAELLMLHTDGSVSSYSMKDCGFFPRGYCLKNTEKIRAVDWSKTELLTGGLFGEEWLICEKKQPGKILAVSSKRLLEELNEIFETYTKEAIVQLILTEDSVLAVTKQGEIVQKWLVNCPNPEYSVWLTANPETRAYGYMHIEQPIRKIYYDNGALFAETEESVYVPGGVWGPKRLAYVLKAKKASERKGRRRKIEQ